MLFEKVPDNYLGFEQLFIAKETFYIGTGPDGATLAVEEAPGTRFRLNLLGRRKHSPRIAMIATTPLGVPTDYTHVEDMAMVTNQNGAFFTTQIDAWENESVVLTTEFEGSGTHTLPADGDKVEIAYLMGPMDGLLQVLDVALLKAKKHISELWHLRHPDLAPEPFLNHFLHMLGWNMPGVNLEPAADAVDADRAAAELRKRQLIRLAVSLYKQKGTRQGITNLIRLLTGFEAQVLSWNNEQAWELGIDTRDRGRNLGFVNIQSGALESSYEPGDEYTQEDLVDWADSGERTIALADGTSVTVHTRRRYRGARLIQEPYTLQAPRFYEYPAVEITEDFAGTAQSGVIAIRFTHSATPDPVGLDLDNTSDLRFEFSLNGGHTWNRATVRGTGADPTKIARYNAANVFQAYDGDLSTHLGGGIYSNKGAVGVTFTDSAGSYHEVEWDTEADNVALDRGEAGVKFRIVAWSRVFAWYGDGDATAHFTVNNSPGPTQASDIWDFEPISRPVPLTPARGEWTLGCSHLGSLMLGPPSRNDRGFFYHFDVFVFAAELTEQERRTICRIIEWAKPAWTHFTLVLDEEATTPGHWMLDESDLGNSTILA